MCIAAGLVGGEAFSIDASLIKADVDKKKRAPGNQPIAWPKAEETSRAVGSTWRLSTPHGVMRTKAKEMAMDRRAEVLKESRPNKFR